jgi:hypothetical protein
MAQQQHDAPLIRIFFDLLQDLPLTKWDKMYTQFLADTSPNDHDTAEHRRLQEFRDTFLDTIAAKADAQERAEAVISVLVALELTTCDELARLTAAIEAYRARKATQASAAP